MSEVAIALGANLGGAAEIAARFEAALAELAEVAAGPIRRSGLYAGPAVGPVADQDEFINAVAVFDGVAGLAPEALLGRLLAIEAAHGRVRSVRFGPRTLDLDLLWVGDRRVESADLSLPHPRMLGRRFVLEPLAELLGAERVVPGAGASLGALLARPEVEPAALRRLPAG